MYKPLILIVLLLSSSFGVLDVSSIDNDVENFIDSDIQSLTPVEEKPRPMAINHIPFKELATIIIDQINDEVKISYSLMSKDKKDFQIPDSFETKILNEKRIESIVYTNMEKCAPGVTQTLSQTTGSFLYPTCLLVNIPLNETEGDSFIEKRNVAREIGDSVIDDINQVLDTNVKYHSTAIQQTGNNPTFNVVYTMPHWASKLLYNVMLLNNIPEEIRFAGGFLNNAKMLSNHENSVFTFAMSPERTRMLYSLSISELNPGRIGIGNFSPLDLFVEDKLNRSKLFAEGFYPLNSIINIIIFSNDQLQVLKTGSSIIGSLANADELQKNGWYFVSDKSDSTDEIKKLDLRYLFGKTNSVNKQQLLLSINPVVENITLIDVPQNDVPQNGGGCLIATAAFGSEMAPQVQFLREIRDNTVLQTELGTNFISIFNQFYYSFSPAIADYERENTTFKEAVKLTLTPLLTSLTLLQYADIDSESEMLEYGIGVILLNIGMYFVAPAILVMKIRKLIEKPHLKN